MTIYMFGLRVTEQEQAFLKNILIENTRLEQGKHFKAIYRTAQRNNVSLIDANDIFEKNKQFIEKMNPKHNNVYSMNKNGELCKNGKLYNILDHDLFSKQKENDLGFSTKTLYGKIKYVILYIKSLFEVY